MPNSIRGRLALLVLASITLVWTIALGWSYLLATREVAEWDSARLVQLAQFIVLLDQNDLSILSNARNTAVTQPAPPPRMVTKRRARPSFKSWMQTAASSLAARTSRH
jgi:hypothetical protein